jgi:malonyl-ACP decarboxylase
VVTGMGVVSPYGLTLMDFERSLRAGDSAISYLASAVDEGSFYQELAGAHLEQKVLREKLAQDKNKYSDEIGRLLARGSLSLQSAALSTQEAWENAGLDNYARDARYSDCAHRIGIVVAGNNIDQQSLSHTYERYREKTKYISASHALQYQDTHYVGVLSELFGLKGESHTVGAASASGNVAIITASRMIRHGYLDACVVLGPLTRLSRFELQSFINCGAYGGVDIEGLPAQASRPFDEEHRGFVLGAASGALILEAEGHAQTRGVAIQARVLGACIRLDGNHSSDPSLEGQIAVMKGAMAEAGVSVEEIHYLNAHATSTPLGDRTEVEAIETLFARNPDLWVNSTKGMIGHCLNAAGVVETIASILQMNGGYIHENLNLEKPISERLRLSRRTELNQSISVFMKIAFGFGGFNSSTIFGKGT